MDDRGDLVAAVEDTRVREDGHATRGQGRGEIPVPPALEALQRPLLAHRLVLGPVELVDLLLESTAIELHRDEVSPKTALDRFCVILSEMKIRLRTALAVASAVAVTAVAASALAFTGNDASATKPSGAQKARTPAALADQIRAERRESYSRTGCSKHMRQNTRTSRLASTRETFTRVRRATRAPRRTQPGRRRLKRRLGCPPRERRVSRDGH